MTDRDRLLDELARCYARAAVDRLLEAHEPAPVTAAGTVGPAVARGEDCAVAAAPDLEGRP